MDLGNKLKNLRLVLSMTQQEVANRLDVTKGYISQVENNVTSPSMKLFMDMLDLYGKTPSDFFGAVEKPDNVVCNLRDSIYEERNDSLGYAHTDLVKTHSSFELQFLELEPDGRTPLIKGSAGEEFGYVLEGRIELINDEKRYVFDRGDSFYFPATEDHYYQNTYSKETRIIWFKTPRR